MYLEIFLADFPVFLEFSGISQKYLNFAGPRPHEISEALSMSLFSRCNFCLLPEHTNGNGDYTSSLLGILVMQDVHLGLLVALLPAIAGQKGMAPSKGNTGVVHNILNGLEKESDSGNLVFFNSDCKTVSPYYRAPKKFSSIVQDK